MAAEENEGSVQQKRLRRRDGPTDDLTSYRETMYWSKNKVLKNMMGQMGGVDVDAEIYDLLRLDRYQKFDTYVQRRFESSDFTMTVPLDILQQILGLKYNLLKQPVEPLSRKQVQNALGIHQARWACCRHNPIKFKDDDGRPIEFSQPFEFVYYEDAVKVNPWIPVLIGDEIKKKLYIPEPPYEAFKQLINATLKGTVWYFYADADYKRLKRKQKEWLPNVRHFPIPESIAALCSIACIHQPELIFGSIRSSTLTKHVVKYGVRPFTLNLPLAEIHPMNVTGLDDVDGVFQQEDLLNIWGHDMLHLFSGRCDRQQQMYTFLNQTMAEFHGSIDALFLDKDEKDLYEKKLGTELVKFDKTTHVELTEDNIEQAFDDPGSELNYCIEWNKKLYGSKRHFEKNMEDLNDTQPVFSSNMRTVCYEGGRRRMKRTSKKIRKNKKIKQELTLNRFFNRS